MSQANVDVVRRTASALAAGDWQGVFETWDPQIEWHFERDAVISGIHRGRDQVRAALSSFMAEWEDFAVEVEELIAADHGQVVMFAHLTGRGRGSGLPLDFREANIFTIREGRIAVVKEYFDRERALEAAGLWESAMSQDNVDLVQAAYAAYERGDLAWIVEACDPDIEISEAPELPDGRTYRGHQGLLDALDHWGGEWRDLTLEIERIESVGDQVVSLVHQRGRGKLSGAPVDMRVAYLHTFRNGKGVRWQMFATWEKALEAAGPPG